MSGKIEKMSNETAAAIWNNFPEQDPEKLKTEITKKLDTMLASGEISQEDYNIGIKLTNKNSIMTALAGRNRTESTKSFEDLANTEIGELMKNIGLNVDVISEISKEVADSDYTIHDKGLKQIRKALNSKIKELGVDYKLSKKETRILVESIGINVKQMSLLKKILLNVAPMLSIGGPLGAVLTITGVPGKVASLVNQISERKTEKTMDKLAAKVAQSGSSGEKNATIEVAINNENLKDAIEDLENNGAKVQVIEQKEKETLIKVEVDEKQNE